jgi:2-polyprenyl-3-methyl-5-hydroxy-6-metoxy-1,4-benzoquinol methylase
MTTVNDNVQPGKVEAYFSRNADEWHDLYINPRHANDMVLRDRMYISARFVEKYVPAGGKILDAGCGAGLLSDFLARKEYVVHGVDISPTMIDMCREHFDKNFPTGHPHRFSAGDISQLNLEPASFDAIAALGFLEYQEDEMPSLRYFYSLLKPGGRLIITGPLKTSIALRLSYMVSKLTKKPDPRPSISIHLYTPSRFKELLTPPGFVITDIHRHGFSSFPIIGGGRKGILLHKILSGISKVLPMKALCNDIVVAAYKPLNQ